MWPTRNADKGSVSELMVNPPLNALVRFAVDRSSADPLVFVLYEGLDEGLTLLHQERQSLSL